MPKPTPRMAAPLALLLMVAACAPPPPAADAGAATGAAVDPADACARQAANVDAARGLFAGSVIAGAALGAAAGGGVSVRVGIVPGSAAMLGAMAAGALVGAAAGAAAGDYLERRRRDAADEIALSAAVAADIARENENLDLARNAAEFLIDCRLRRAQDIREALAEGRISAASAEAGLAALRSAAQQDAARIAAIDERIRARDTEFAPAIDALAPGARTEGVAEAPGQSAPVRAVAPLPLRPRARPDATAVALAEIPAGTAVQLRRSRDPDFVAVETTAGQRLGYAPAAAFPGAAPRQPPPIAGPETALRYLAATNVVRRDNFSETLADATRAASGQGFEPGI